LALAAAPNRRTASDFCLTTELMTPDNGAEHVARLACAADNEQMTRAELPVAPLQVADARAQLPMRAADSRVALAQVAVVAL
jgi:hypothetical protein